MRPKIAASILAAPADALGEATVELDRAGADWVHLDVMDGCFVPPISFGADLAACVCSRTDRPVEAHLMVAQPERHIDAFLEVGCQRIVFHLEATDHAHRLVQRIREADVEAGVAINPQTSATSLAPLLGEIDLALVMTVNPGWGGQKLIPMCLQKVAEIRAIAPDLEIEVDGGIDDRSCVEAKAAGATIMVVGSYLTSASNPADAIGRLHDALA